ncbi:EAL domain-containing protein [Vibrio sp.]|nr:EAL domain-containing protein [Vibrio sp.]
MGQIQEFLNSIDKTSADTSKEAIELALSDAGIELAYQPIFDVDSETPVRIEALVRYISAPEISSQKLIDAIVTHDLATQYHDWLIDKSFKRLAQWKEEYPDLVLHINVPFNSIGSQSLLDCLFYYLDHYTLSAQDICIEITEKYKPIDATKAMDELHLMREKGFTVALDDFGQGYANLYHLSQLPINMLKIDKEFVLNFDECKKCVAIVNSVISLAHELDIDLVVEGAENQDIIAFLKASNVSYVQGFIWGAPVIVRDEQEISFAHYLRQSEEAGKKLCL